MDTIYKSDISLTQFLFSLSSPRNKKTLVSFQNNINTPYSIIFYQVREVPRYARHYNNISTYNDFIVLFCPT